MHIVGFGGESGIVLIDPIGHFQWSGSSKSHGEVELWIRQSEHGKMADFDNLARHNLGFKREKPIILCMDLIRVNCGGAPMQNTPHERDSQRNQLSGVVMCNFA